MQDDDASAIAALIAADDDQAAFARLRSRLAWPRGKDLGELASWLAVLADLARRRGAKTLAELAARAVRDPDSPDQLYDLGYALIDAGAPAIAATLLWRCLALVGDSEEVICELVSALESALAYPDAFAILEDHAALRARSFMCQYLYAFNAAMSGRLDVTRIALGALQIDPAAPETESMHAAIAAIVERADRVAGRCSLDRRDLRGWHYVITGGLVLHQSPYGYDGPMHGRYAYLQDSIARIATGLDRLATLVARIPCIYAPPGRDHEILAQAASLRLGLPRAPWPAIGVPSPGLVVIYDLDELPRADHARLVQRRADQILYAHACPWVHDVPVAPDATMLLCQKIVPPWAETTAPDPDGRPVRTVAADPRSVEEIAAEIAASPGLASQDNSADEAARWDQLVDGVWPLAPGPRARLWAGGPVSSNPFETVLG